MKKYITFILGIMLFSLISLTCSAVSLDSFVIEPQYLSNGVVQINSNPTTILADISISRSLIAGTQTFESVNWTVTLVLRDYNTNNQYIISTPLTITSADFNGTAYCNKTITAVAPANRYSSTYLPAPYSAFTYNSKIFLIYSTNVTSGISSGNPTYSVNKYPAVVNYYSDYAGLNSSYPGTVWGGEVRNFLYDGYPVPLPLPQLVTKSPVTGASGYTYLDWITIQVNVDNSTGTEPGTIINFNDNGPILTQGQTIYSPDNQYRLTLQTDGNLVLYNSSNIGLWNSKTQGKPALGFFFQSDLNIILRNGYVHASPSVWTAGGIYDLGGYLTRYNRPNIVMAYPYLKLQDDGNLVLHWPTGLESTLGGPASPVEIILEATQSGAGASGVPSGVSTISGYILPPLNYTDDPANNDGSAPANYFEITH